MPGPLDDINTLLAQGEGAEDENPTGEEAGLEKEGAEAEETVDDVESETGSEDAEGAESEDKEGEKPVDELSEIKQTLGFLVNAVKEMKQAASTEPKGPMIPAFEPKAVKFVVDDDSLVEITGSAEAFNTAMNAAVGGMAQQVIEHMLKALPPIISETSARISENTVLVRDFYRDNQDLERLGPDYRAKVAEVYEELERRNPGASPNDLLAMLPKAVRIKYKLNPQGAQHRPPRNGAFVPSGHQKARMKGPKASGIGAELSAMENLR